MRLQLYALLLLTSIFTINGEDNTGRDNTLSPSTPTNHITKSPTIIITAKPCQYIDDDGCIITPTSNPSPSNPLSTNNVRGNITLIPTISTNSPTTQTPTSFTNDSDNINALSLPPTPAPSIPITINRTDNGRNVSITKTPTISTIAPTTNIPTTFLNDKDPSLEPTYIPTIEPTIHPTTNPSIYQTITTINPTMYITNTDATYAIQISKNNDNNIQSVVVFIIIFVLITVCALFCCFICFLIGRGSANTNQSIEMDLKKQIQIGTHIDKTDNTQTNVNVHENNTEMDLELKTDTHSNVDVRENNTENIAIIVNTPGEEIDLMEEIIVGVVVDNTEQNVQSEEGKVTGLEKNDNAYSPIEDNASDRKAFPDIDFKESIVYSVNIGNEITKKDKAYPMDISDTKGNDLSMNITKTGKAYPMNVNVSETKGKDMSLNVTKSDKAYPMNVSETKGDDIGMDVTVDIGNTKGDDVGMTKEGKAYPTNTKKGNELNYNKETDGMAMPMNTAKGSDIEIVDNEY